MGGSSPRGEQSSAQWGALGNPSLLRRASASALLSPSAPPADTTCACSSVQTSSRGACPAPLSHTLCWAPTPCRLSWATTMLRSTWAIMSVSSALPPTRRGSWRSASWSCTRPTGEPRQRTGWWPHAWWGTQTRVPLSVSLQGNDPRGSGDPLPGERQEALHVRGGSTPRQGTGLWGCQSNGQCHPILPCCLHTPPCPSSLHTMKVQQGHGSGWLCVGAEELQRSNLNHSM